VFGHINVPRIGEHNELAAWLDEKREMKKAGNDMPMGVTNNMQERYLMRLEDYSIKLESTGK
jgi:hypothetical protein